MTEIKLINAYPGVVRILFAIDLESGRLSREDPVDERLMQVETFLENDKYPYLHELNLRLRYVSYFEILDLVADSPEDGMMTSLMSTLPFGTNDFLNRYYNNGN